MCTWVPLLLPMPSDSRANWNLGMLVFKEKGKPEYGVYPQKNLGTRVELK